MSETAETIESLRAALRAAEERAALAEARLSTLEELISLVPGILVEYEWDDATGGSRPKVIGGAGVDSLFGFTNEEALSDRYFFTKNIHPEDAERAGAEAMEFLVKGESHLSPHRMLCKDGTYRWVVTHFLYNKSTEDQASELHAIVLDVSKRVQAEEEAKALLATERELRQRLDGFVASVPGVAWETFFEQDPAKQRVNYVSDAVESLSGYTVAEWQREPNFWLNVIVPEDRAGAHREMERIFENGAGQVVYRWRRKDGQELWVNGSMTIIRDEHGAPIGLRGVTMDVTGLKRAEEQAAEARVREEVIRAQEESLLALSTPLVPIDDDLLAMTLVGGLDERRADRVLSTLLEGVTRTGARTVILDVTGVPEVDAQTADAVLRAARAVRLLGAEVVLTGIRPEVARTLVTIGADLGSIVTKATLKAGIAHALRSKKGNGGLAKPARSR